uniref:Uncharacterized protein n=1 Tax=Nicotiana tabacum TaxID=4097 RepID=A0A1S4AKK8_TOBAC|nr:PREDICTED: uncharacterized protein LOC107798639 [Nicotiana tabacum]
MLFCFFTVFIPEIASATCLMPLFCKFLYVRHAFWEANQVKQATLAGAFIMVSDFSGNFFVSSKLFQWYDHVVDLPVNASSREANFPTCRIMTLSINGRNVNKPQNAQEQVHVISLPQRSGSNVEQSHIVEQTEIVVQPTLQEEVNDIPAPQGVENNIEALVLENDVVIQQQNLTTPVVTSRSERIIKKPLRFALLGESYDRIPEEPNTEPLNYDEAL